MKSLLRELAVSVYLVLVRFVFSVYKLFPLQDKVVLIETIGGHSAYLYRTMKAMQNPFRLVLLTSGKSRKFRDVEGNFLKGNGAPTVVPFTSGNPVFFLLSLYHVATARSVLVDNYVGLLAGVTFRPGVECIQLWHAVGGFKRTGLGDKTITHRSSRARSRFQRVYNQFHKLAVGSEGLAKIHMDAFGLPYERMLKTGVPRTDLFFDMGLMSHIKETLLRNNPGLKGKRVLLYAPTYRDGETKGAKLQLDLSQLQSQVGQDSVILLRLHPAVTSEINYEALYPGFVFDYSSYPVMNDLLLVADCLITDYSSVICEYALLGKPMVFFLYDLEEFLEKRGLWDGYESLVPGPVVYTMSELIGVIRDWKFDFAKIRQFARMWNTYSNGESSRHLLEYLQKSTLATRRL